MSKKQLLTSACLLALALWCAPALAQSAAARSGGQDEAARALTLVGGGDNFLGVYTEAVTRENMSRWGLSGEPRGVAVTQVIENSPAAKAGLQRGDVILRFDGEAVTSPLKLQRLISEAAPGHTARLSVARGGSEREISATLGKREAARAFGLFSSPEGRARLWDDEEWKRRAEEWKEYGERWQQNSEEWKRRSEELRKQLEAMPRGGYTLAFRTGRRIGVTTTTLTEQLADYFGVSERRGLLVTSVAADSPAAKAGLKAGDVIVEADGEKVNAAGELSRAINRKEAGEVTLTVVRDRSRRTVRVTPEKAEGPTGLVLPQGLFAAPSIAEFDLPNVRIREPRVLKLVSPLRLAPLTLPSVKPLAPRIVVPSRVRETIIL